MVKADDRRTVPGRALLVDVDPDARQALLAMLEESHVGERAVLLEQGSRMIISPS